MYYGEGGNRSHGTNSGTRSERETINICSTEICLLGPV